MTRTTSAKAYRELVESGQLAKKEAEALEYIHNNEPVMGCDIPNQGWKRVSALCRKGLVCEWGTALNPDTNKRVIVWGTKDFQGVIANQYQPSKPTRKALEEKITHLEARCIELETIIAGYPTLMGLVYDKGYQEGAKDGTTGNIVGLEGI